MASQGFLGGASEQTLSPTSLLLTLAFGTHYVGAPGTQYITPGSLLMVQQGGVHVVSGGNVVARWLWVKVWQPLWTWIDGAVGSDSES
jgi:hypothetical protein